MVNDTMKKLLLFLIILVGGFYLYNKCSHRNTQSEGVLKQVSVSVKTANLRTGPGTNYDFVLDANGAKQQVSKGTVLDVVAEKQGWYEIQLKGESTSTAYIKQSLCADLNPTASRKAKSNGRPKQETGTAVPEEASSGSSPGYHISADEPSTPTPHSAEEVVEEVTSGSGSEDEIIY